MQPAHPLPPPRPASLPPPKSLPPAKTPPPRPTTTPTPMGEFTIIDTPTDLMNFTTSDTAVESKFAEVYNHQAQAGERLAQFCKIQSIVSDNLELIGKLTGNQERLKLSFLPDGHIDTDSSTTIYRAMRGPVTQLLTGNNPDDIRNLAVFMQFLKNHYADYRHDNQHMHQEISKLQTAAAGLKALAQVYLTENKEQNLEILDKSIQQLNLCTKDLENKINKNDTLSLPQLTGMFEEMVVRLKLKAPDDRSVQIAGVAQSIQALDGIEVIKRTDSADIHDDFGRFAKCIAHLSIGSKPEEYLLKELILAEYVILQEEPALKELRISELRNELAQLESELTKWKERLARLETSVSSEDSEENFKALFAAEDKVKDIAQQIAAISTTLTNAEAKLSPEIQQHLKQIDGLHQALSAIKESYQADIKNQLAIKHIKASGLFAEALQLAGHPIDAPDLQFTIAEEAQSPMFKAAKLAAGITLSGLSFLYPTLAPLTPFAINLIKEGIAEADMPYLQQAQAILDKVGDPTKAKKELEALDKQIKDNKTLSDSIWGMYHKHFG